MLKQTFCKYNKRRRNQAKVENFYDAGVEHLKDHVSSRNSQFSAKNCFSFQYVTYFELKKSLERFHQTRYKKDKYSCRNPQNFNWNIRKFIRILSNLVDEKRGRSWAAISLSFKKVDNINKSRHVTRGGRGENSPAFFRKLEKYPDCGHLWVKFHILN